MRLTWFLLLAAVLLARGAETEDLRAVQVAFQKQDASLDWFEVLDKKPIDAADSAMLVGAAPTEPWRGTSRRAPVYPKEQIGLFVVSGKANQVQLLLDSFALSSVMERPKLELVGGDTAYLHFYSDYGFYSGSIKYVFDLASHRPPQKIRYSILALTSVRREREALLYQASSYGGGSEPLPGWTERQYLITIEPRGGDSMPDYRIVDAQPKGDAAPSAPTPLRLADGQKVLVVHTSSPDQRAQAAGVELTANSGRQLFFPLPIPTQARYHELRPKAQKAESLENDIGPYAAAGTKLWFADTFYDGEGVSGLGAIGSFDAVTHAFEMRNLPEIAAWSGSALVVDGRDLWVGLMGRPEGANYGGGLLRYNMDTGKVTTYPVHDLIHTLDIVGDTLYCGTSHGLYTVRGGKVTQLRFEPDAIGKLSMLAREVR